jgi:membrane protease YdiL (CAAX protease family)
MINRTETKFLVIETWLLIVLCTALLWSSVITNTISIFGIRGHYPFLILIIAYLIYRRIQRKKLMDFVIIGDWKKSFLSSSVFTLSFIGLGFLALRLGIFDNYIGYSDRGVPSIIFLLFYIFIGVPLQQLIVWVEFRDRLDTINFPVIGSYLVLSTIYSLSHGFYQRPEIILFGTFILGVFWTWNIYRTNSLITNYFSHLIIGIAMFYLAIA